MILFKHILTRLIYDKLIAIFLRVLVDIFAMIKRDIISFFFQKIDIIFIYYKNNNVIDTLSLTMLYLYYNFCPKKNTLIYLNILNLILFINPYLQSLFFINDVIYILNAYLFFVYILALSVMVISDPSIKIKYPLFFNVIIIISSLILFALLITIIYYSHKLFNGITNKILESIENFILKMMGGFSNPNPSQPGGSGEPSGGGGRPPQNHNELIRIAQEAQLRLDELYKGINNRNNEVREESYGEQDEYYSDRDFDNNLPPAGSPELAKTLKAMAQHRWYEKLTDDQKDERNKTRRDKAHQDIRRDPIKHEWELAKSREKNNKAYANLSTEAKQDRLAKKQVRRANEAPEKKEARLAKMRANNRKRLASETLEGRERRLEGQKAWRKMQKEKNKEK